MFLFGYALRSLEAISSKSRISSIVILSNSRINAVNIVSRSMPPSPLSNFVWLYYIEHMFVSQERLSRRDEKIPV